MKREKIAYDVKLKAVGEVMLGVDTLETIGEKYGISGSYLSTLYNRAKRAILPVLMKSYGDQIESNDMEPCASNPKQERLDELSVLRMKIEKMEREIRKE